MTFKIRNDDLAVDTDIEQFEIFCNVCDRWGFPIIQCITPVGEVQFIDSKMDNDYIRKKAGDRMFIENTEVYEYLKGRDDEISIHGYWHTHYPTLNEMIWSKQLLTEWGLAPKYNTYPFNELTVPEDVCGLKTLDKSQRLEDYHRGGIPTDPIVYLHSWRYDGSWYTIDDLNRTLERLSMVKIGEKW